MALLSRFKSLKTINLVIRLFFKLHVICLLLGIKEIFSSEKLFLSCNYRISSVFVCIVFLAFFLNTVESL